MRKLPLDNTPQALEIIDAILSYNIAKIDELWSKYNFVNRYSFTSSVAKTYGIKLSDAVMPRIEKFTPTELSTPKGERVTFAIINDTHNPYQDEIPLSLVEGFLAEIHPDYLVYNGDVNDFYQVSKFDKNPKRLDKLGADINNTKAMFRRHKHLLPNTKKILLGGNHEDRWQKFLWTSAGVLAGLKCLTIPELFELSEFDIDYIPYEQGLMVNGLFLIIHSDISSVHSGYTAKRLFEKHGGCGICGHCHRGGSFYKRDRFGIWGWWENFCLCSLNPDWIKNPNWVQGFSLIHFLGKRFWVEQLPIIKNSFVYGGREYSA